MGFRNATIRQLKVPDLTTTVLTLTLTGIAADTPLTGGANPNLVRRIGSVASIFVGAAAGAWLVAHPLAPHGGFGRAPGAGSGYGDAGHGARRASPCRCHPSRDMKGCSDGR
jgi:hypothetical protein